MRHPFRFGVTAGPPTSRDQWLARVRRIEELGYSTVEVGSHISRGSPGILAAIATAAAITTSLRVATRVVPNDFYHPAVLAQEIATLDVLSGGRVELGLGTGWMRTDYDVTAMPYLPGGVRLSRLEEALRVVRALLRGEASPAGQHYPAMGPLPGARPTQQPHPPIFLGGSGRRMLCLAAREADVVGVDLSSTAAGTMDLASITLERVAEKVGWVRQAAGDRFDTLELAILVHNVFVVDDRMRGAQMAADRIASFPPTVVTHADLSLEQLVASPHVLVGSVDQIADTLRERRDRFGISRVSVMAPFAEEFAPVIARLAGS